ncbi:MAG: murein biosynthesis integral membrane protein MurJ [Gemmatimonadota bacterium]
MTPSKAPSRRTSARSAQWVAAGIFLSRLSGLVREALFARFLGTSYSADALRAALRMPNVLQNLLGEGTLSASFIPVYAELLEQGREEEAGRVAGAVFALLLALAGGLALLGIVAAPVLVSILAPGFVGTPRFALTVTLVRIIFPMAGLFVLAAWSLGILNSHRRFFIPYVAPVLWNGAMIAAMLVFGFRYATPARQPSLAIVVGWAALLGGSLQFLVQLPWVLRLERSLHVRWDTKLRGVRTTVRNALPAIAGRGVVQIAGWVDLILASLLAVGSVATLSYAQTLYMLPVSLFGMSVAAAELPELARERSQDRERLRLRVNAGLQRMAFFVVPTVLGYLALGDLIVAGLYQRGAFGRADTLVVWLVLLGFTLGLFASTGTRLFSSAFFALHDTKTPAKTATIRVATAAVVGVGLMVQLEPVHTPAMSIGALHVSSLSFGPYGFGIWRTPGVAGQPLGVLGLTLAAGMAAWLEWWLLRARLSRHLGPVAPPGRPVGRMILAAIVAAVAGRGVVELLPAMRELAFAGLGIANIVRMAAGVGVFGVVYLWLGHMLGLDEADHVLRRLLGRPNGRRA